MEGAGFVLIRTSFQFPSAQALEPLNGQPHFPPTACNLVFVPLHELGGVVSGAALPCLWPNPGSLCVTGMYQVALLEPSLSC